MNNSMPIITETSDLTAFCARLADHPYVAVDTEFLRETTYYPKLCLIQMANPDEVALIDALAPGHRSRAVLRADGG